METGTQGEGRLIGDGVVGHLTQQCWRTARSPSTWPGGEAPCHRSQPTKLEFYHQNSKKDFRCYSVSRHGLNIEVVVESLYRPFSSRFASAHFRVNNLFRFAHFSKLIHSVIPFCKITSEKLSFP